MWQGIPIEEFSNGAFKTLLQAHENQSPTEKQITVLR